MKMARPNLVWGIPEIVHLRLYPFFPHRCGRDFLLMIRPHLSAHSHLCAPHNLFTLFFLQLPFQYTLDMSSYCSCFRFVLWSPLSWRDPGSKSIPSVSSFSPSYQTFQVNPAPTRVQQTPPPTETSKVPAVMVDERDMYSILDGIFGGRESYKVSLDRDVYRIKAPRKLTLVRNDASSPHGKMKGSLT